MLLSCLLLLTVISASSQQTYIDSLQQALLVTRSDPDKILALNRIGEYYEMVQSDSCMKYGRLLIELSQQVHDDYGEFMGYMLAFWSLNIRGDYPKALELLLTTGRIADHLKTQQALAQARVSDYMGLINMEMLHYPQAIAYCRNTIFLYANLEQQVRGMWSGYSVLSSVYLRQHQLDSGLYYAEKSYDVFIRNKDVERFGSLPLAVLATAHLQNGHFDLAEKYYRQGIDAAKHDHVLYLLARTYYNIGNLFGKEGKMDSSIHYASLSLGLCQQYNYANYARDASLVLANAYEAQKKPDSALKYFKFMVAANDSLFNQQRMDQFAGLLDSEKRRRQEIEAAKASYRGQIQIYALLAIIAVFAFFALVQYRNSRQRQKANALLSTQKKTLETTIGELKSTQAQLIQSEKMASLGELTAGIAHEIQNPLNFVNNFSEVNSELVDELQLALEQGNQAEAIQLSTLIRENERKISSHGKRAEAIVKGMLQHSRTRVDQKESTDINELADEYLRLSYQGWRAKDKDFQSKINTDFDPEIGTISVIQQDIGRVLLNMFNNAFYAVSQQRGRFPAGYEPTVSVSTKKASGQLDIMVSDNGTGIPKDALSKIFQPFFTTKPAGQGTGLGLSLSYDIVKAHGGELTVETHEGVGTTFIIRLPA